MAEQNDTTPEAVALKLVHHVAFIEKRSIQGQQESRSPADRKWLLDTYAECLEATRGLRTFTRQA